MVFFFSSQKWLHPFLSVNGLNPVLFHFHELSLIKKKQGQIDLIFWYKYDPIKRSLLPESIFLFFENFLLNKFNRLAKITPLKPKSDDFVFSARAALKTSRAQSPSYCMSDSHGVEIFNSPFYYIRVEILEKLAQNKALVAKLGRLWAAFLKKVSGIKKVGKYASFVLSHLAFII